MCVKVPKGKVRDPMSGALFDVGKKRGAALFFELEEQKLKDEEEKCKKTPKKRWNCSTNKCEDYNDDDEKKPDSCVDNDTSIELSNKIIFEKGLQSEESYTEAAAELRRLHITPAVYSQRSRQRTRQRTRQRSIPRSNEEKVEEYPVLDSDITDFRNLLTLVVLIAKYDDTKSAPIAAAFAKYTDGLMLRQKNLLESKIELTVSGMNMIYPNSPFIGSSAIGFIFEGIFDNQYIQDKEGDDKIWRGTKPGSVYDFSLNVTAAMKFVSKNLDDENSNIIIKKEIQKTLKGYGGIEQVTTILNKWVEDESKDFGLYLNLKVELAKKGSSNLGIASRNDLLKLYLGTTKYDTEYRDFSTEEMKEGDNPVECKSLKNLLDHCDEQKRNCMYFRDAYDGCIKQDQYVDKQITNTIPKLYLIVKMLYDFDTIEQVINIKNYKFLYIDGIFRYLNWTSGRLMANTQAIKQGVNFNNVPSFRKVLLDLVRKQFPAGAQYIVALLPTKKIIGEVKEKYDALIQNVKGQWWTPEEIVTYEPTQNIEITDIDKKMKQVSLSQLSKYEDVKKVLLKNIKDPKNPKYQVI